MTSKFIKKIRASKLQMSAFIEEKMQLSCLPRRADINAQLHNHHQPIGPENLRIVSNSVKGSITDDLNERNALYNDQLFPVVL